MAGPEGLTHIYPNIEDWYNGISKDFSHIIAKLTLNETISSEEVSRLKDFQNQRNYIPIAEESVDFIKQIETLLELEMSNVDERPISQDKGTTSSTIRELGGLLNEVIELIEHFNQYAMDDKKAHIGGLIDVAKNQPYIQREVVANDIQTWIDELDRRRRLIREKICNQGWSCQSAIRRLIQNIYQ